MRRREVIGLLGGGGAWPLAGLAQQLPMPVLGFLNGGSPDAWAAYVAAFHEGLKEAGFVEGRNLAIEYRWARGRYQGLPALAADLVGRQVAVIVAAGGAPSSLAAKAATSTIPVVFVASSDAVQLGLVGSYSRPGGNITGVSMNSAELEAKKLELLVELLPQARTIAVLINPEIAEAEAQTRAVREAALIRGQRILLLAASTDDEVDLVFAALVRERVDGLLVASDPFFNSARDRLVALARRHKVPAIGGLREFALAGGLISYGNRLPDAYRQVGAYAGRILKGERPADLPVVRPTRFELVMNLATAQALDLTVPPLLLARADEVIE